MPKNTAVQNTKVYIGPTIRGTAVQGAVYSNGVPPKFAAAMKELPALANLLVSPKDAAYEMEKLQEKSSAVAICYQAAQEYAAAKAAAKMKGARR
ncbi:MAG: hypothetical protein Q4C60_07535 [Eubacteriales bacterium]|nr:hypothetical protein [Eubacteriales bacterium]